MTPELVVPVIRVPVSLVLYDGRRRKGAMFLPPCGNAADLLEDGEPFVPIKEPDGLRVYARAAVACVVLRPEFARDIHDTHGEVQLRTWRVRVHLRSGIILCGELRHPASIGRARTTDCLNEPQRSFCLHAGRSVIHIAKAQVECVEEA